jgi:inorganic pyrophosphatase
MSSSRGWPASLVPKVSCTLGVVEMDQEEKEGERNRNDWVIVMPAWHDRVGECEHPSDLPARLREEIEQFFLSTTFSTAKNPAILG